MARTVSLMLAVALAAVGVAADTCAKIASTSSIAIEWPLTLDYTTDQTEYWSTSCSGLLPSCILAPKSAQEVSAIVSVLNSNKDRFAIKSGGHNPNNFFSSVSGGPLISTKNLNQVILDTASQTAEIGPGNRWDDVASALDGTGWSAVGGRIGNVGVGGYMLGGGLSFMSGQYGWAASNVVEFTLVLANASIITVNQNNNPDLFKALKGGGNNFGIVTSYKVKVYQQGDIWGGNLIFTASDAVDVALLTALRDFTEYNTDDKAAIIMTAERTAVGLVDIWVMFLYYNGPTPPAGLFDNFTNAGPFENTCKTQSYATLLTGNNWSVLKGSVYTIGTETTPLPSSQNGLEVMMSYYQHWRNVSSTVLGVPNLIASIAFQPMPKSISAKALSMGGDLISLDADVDRIFIELDYSFLLNASFPLADTAMKQTYGGLKTLVDGYTASGKLPSAYLPLFMNDGYYAEDYFGRLKPENAQLARSLSAKLDPNGLWKNRTGGFKP